MKLTIFRKLMLGFTVVVVLAVAVAAFQLFKFSETMRLVDSIARDDTTVYVAAARIAERRASIQGLREASLAAVALGRVGGVAPAQLDELQQRYRAEAAEAVTAAREIESMAADKTRHGLTASRREIWAEMRREAAAVAQMMDDAGRSGQAVMQALRDGDVDQAMRLRPAVNEASGRIRERLNGLMAVCSRLTEAGHGDVVARFREATLSAVATTLLVLIVAIAASVTIARSISRPLEHSIALAKRIGGGDLSGELPVDRRDELGDLARALNDMTGKLRAIAAGTRSSAESLNAAAAQIRASTQEQAAAVAEQLAAIEETSATLTEITQSGAHMSGRAQEVIVSAQGTRGATDQGLKAVEDTVAVMDGIRAQVETVAENIVVLSQRTQAIGDIIMSVSTIAERSHLLALNASIEAAAAGEHGRTFSIVAGEIKKLADQARDATQQVRTNLGEIQQGINASVMLTEEAAKRVASGRRQSDAAEAAIRRMAESVQESIQAFQQIVAGINQHQIGLEQGMQALQNIRSASTQTSGSTRELERAAGNMGELSQILVAAVRDYKL